MMVNMSRIHVLIVALLVGPLSALAAAQVNPDYASWAQYGPGTTVTSRQTSKFPGFTSEVTIIRTLIEKNAERVVIELKMVTNSDAPQLPPSRMEIKSQMQPQRGRGARPSNVEFKESEETVTIAGKEYQAKVTEAIRKEASQTVTEKTWTSANFPGLTIKSTMRMEGGQNNETSTVVTDAVLKPGS